MYRGPKAEAMCPVTMAETDAKSRNVSSCP